MNQCLRLTLIILIGLFLSSYTFAAVHTKDQVLDRIIVIVNNAVITQTELEEAIAAVKKQFINNQTPLPSKNELKEQVLNQLIDRKLELQAAEQFNIHPTEAQINKVIQTIAKNNNMSTQELFQKVANDGLNESTYRKEIQEEMMIQEIQRQALSSKMTATPEEINAVMHEKSSQTESVKEYQLEDILLFLPDAASAASTAKTQKQAEELFEKLKKSKNIVVTINELKEDSNIEKNDLDWRSLKDLPSAFIQPLTRAKQNQVVGPIQTANGFHILYVAGIRSTRNNKVMQRKEAEELLYQRQYQKALQEWMMKLRSEAVIKYL